MINIDRLPKQNPTKPTEKQIIFVNNIAELLDLPLPDVYSKESYSQFIDEFKDEFFETKHNIEEVYIDEGLTPTSELWKD